MRLLINMLFMVSVFIIALSAYAQCKLTKNGGKYIISNEQIQLTIDARNNYIIKNLRQKSNPSVSYLSNLQMVADLETKQNNRYVGFLESNANLLEKSIKQSKSKIVITVKWRNKYLENTKTIELKRGESFVRIKYNTLFYQKLPLRFLAVPMINLPSWMNRCYYRNKFGKIIESAAPAQGGKRKIGAISPGLWYATGDGKNGLIVVLPGLSRDYKMFSWHPEWGYGTHLTRNFNVGKLGLVFPHKTAFNAIGDDRLTAEILIAPFSGNPEQAANKILKASPVESMQLRKISLNNAAKYFKPNDNLTVWVDYSQGIHLRDRKLPEKEKLNGSFELAGAKNQIIPFQIIVRPSAISTIKSVKLTGIPFEKEIRLHRYMKLSEPSTLFQNRSSKEYPVEWPDPLMPSKPTKCPADKNQGIWINISIPINASAGIYNGNVELSLLGNKTVKIPLKLKVFDFSLPKVRSYKNICDLSLFLIRYRKVGNVNDSEVQLSYAKIFKDCNLSPNGSVNGFKPHIQKMLSKQGAIITIPRQDALVAFEGRFAARTWKKKHVKYPSKGMTYRRFMNIIDMTYKNDIKKIRKAGVEGTIHAVVVDGALLNKKTKNAVKNVIERIKTTGEDINFVGCIKNNVTTETLGMFDIICAILDLSKKQEKLLKKAVKSGKIKARWTYINNYLAIDSPPVALRSLYWEQYFKGITGNWNWGAIGSSWGNRVKDIYNPKINEILGGAWGLGYLIYPPVNPAEDKRPVPSIRLYQQMCGMDDFEYLKMFDQILSKLEKDSDEYKKGMKLKKKIKNLSKNSLNAKNFDKLNVKDVESLRREMGLFIEKVQNQ